MRGSWAVGALVAMCLLAGCNDPVAVSNANGAQVGASSKEASASAQETEDLMAVTVSSFDVVESPRYAGTAQRDVLFVKGTVFNGSDVTVPVTSVEFTERYSADGSARSYDATVLGYGFESSSSLGSVLFNIGAGETRDFEVYLSLPEGVSDVDVVDAKVLNTSQTFYLPKSGAADVAVPTMYRETFSVSTSQEDGGQSTVAASATLTNLTGEAWERAVSVYVLTLEDGSKTYYGCPFDNVGAGDTADFSTRGGIAGSPESSELYAVFYKGADMYEVSG